MSLSVTLGTTLPAWNADNVMLFAWAGAVALRISSVAVDVCHVELSSLMQIISR